MKSNVPKIVLLYIASSFVLASCAGPQMTDLKTTEKIYVIQFINNVKYTTGSKKSDWQFTFHAGKYSSLYEDKKGVYYHCNGRCITIEKKSLNFNKQFEGGIWVSKLNHNEFRAYQIINDDLKIGENQGALIRSLVKSEIGKHLKKPIIKDEGVIALIGSLLDSKVRLEPSSK